MKKIVQSFLVLMLLITVAFAQERTVTGTVTAKDDGLPIPGASVKVKGTNQGTQTNGSGVFSLKVIGNNPVLVISFIGNATQEVRVGSANSVNVVLLNDKTQLGEVVVTSLGVKRQKKEIGYATAVVSNAVLNAGSAINIANGLQGKVSGLNITTLNSGVFESVKINMRGIRSLKGNNNPMLLLDGVPTDIQYLSSLNPNDVESSTILKGSSAAAIYGPDARNGVIIVTTKSGTKDSKPIITYSNSTQVSQISFFPAFQDKFGSGGFGEYTPYENWSFGPAFDGTVKDIGKKLPDGTTQTAIYSNLKDERKNFFNTGTIFQNDISYAAKDFYISVQDAQIKGIVPEDENRRTGLRLNTSREFGKFKVGLNTNFINQDYSVFDDESMSAYNTNAGVGLNGGLMNLVFNTPGQIPLTSYKDFKNNKFADYNGYFNDYGINPYFAIDNWRKSGKRTDLLTNLDLNFKPFEWLNITYRAGLNSRNVDERTFSKGEMPTPFGLKRSFTPISPATRERAYNYKRYSSELFANLSKQLNEDFKITGILGTYVRQTDTRNTRISAANLIIPEIYNVDHRTGELGGDSRSFKNRLFSVYGSAGASYKGWANIEVTGRNDKTSLLSSENNSFFYPGVSGSFVLTDAIPSLQNKVITYAKLRGAWNKTGNADIDEYSLASTFSQISGFPYGSVPGYTADNTVFDKNLKPEFIESKEIGLETGFWGGRINLEATYFDQKNNNQIIPIRVSQATGYNFNNINAAAFTNKGVELDLRLNPTINSKGLKFNLGVNATYNESKITEIYKDLNELFIGGFTKAANFAIKDYPAFVLKSTDYVRDPQGRIIVDAEKGLPTEDPNTKIYGQTMPKWIVGINPTFDYKNFNLSILAEYKGGHFAYSDIGNAMAWTGVSEATGANNRERFVIPNSSIEDPANPGQYIDNTNVTISDITEFYTGIYRDVRSNFITSAASWRLREVALNYTLPLKLIQKQKFLKSVTIGLTGRNLFLWLPKTNQYQDPDFGNSGTNTTSNTNGATTLLNSQNTAGGNASGISDSQINPPTRVFGGNIIVKF